MAFSVFLRRFLLSGASRPFAKRRYPERSHRHRGEIDSPERRQPAGLGRRANRREISPHRRVNGPRRVVRSAVGRGASWISCGPRAAVGAANAGSSARRNGPMARPIRASPPPRSPPARMTPGASMRICPAKRRDGEPHRGAPTRPVRRWRLGARHPREPPPPAVRVDGLCADLRLAPPRPRPHPPRRRRMRKPAPRTAQDRRMGLRRRPPHRDCNGHEPSFRTNSAPREDDYSPPQPEAAHNAPFPATTETSPNRPSPADGRADAPRKRRRHSKPENRRRHREAPLEPEAFEKSGIAKQRSAGVRGHRPAGEIRRNRASRNRLKGGGRRATFRSHRGTPCPDITL